MTEEPMLDFGNYSGRKADGIACERGIDGFH
jgi:hypothetical protein